MTCPNCTKELKVSSREGVEIDYCPACRGVWLDRGELDKIIERSAATQGRDREFDGDDDDAPASHHGHDRHKKRKRSWLGEMFEFGD